MNEIEKESNYDFFKKIITKKDNSNITENENNNPRIWNFIISAIVCLSIGASIGNGIYNYTKQQQNIEETKTNQYEININYKKDSIKDINDEDFKNIINSLEENRIANLDKLNTIYWKIKYLDDNGDSHTPFNDKVNEWKVYINHYFNKERKEKFTIFYSYTKKGWFYDTDNDLNAANRLYFWKENVNLKNIVIIDELIDFENDIDILIPNKLKLNNYLIDHKKDIEDTKNIFN